MLAAFALLLLPALLCSLASASPAPQKRAVQVVRNCVNSADVAISYDDGMYQFESAIASQFAGDEAATFFVNGQNWGCIYDRADELKALYSAGHTLGSHSWSHPDFNTLTWDQIHDELYKIEVAFEKILGVRPRYFRAPYGRQNDLVLAALDTRGYTKVLLWDVDTKDGDDASVQSQLAQYDGMVSSFPQPHLVLQHSVKGSTAYEVTPAALGKLRGVGYRIVSMQQCLGDDWTSAYTYVGEPQARDASWVC